MAAYIQEMSTLAAASLKLKENIKQPAQWLFNDDLMTVLAFLIIPTVGLPLIFEFSKVMLAIFMMVNYFIIFMFIAEYLVMLYLSESRSRYVLDIWHILDLLIIVLALSDFVPFFSMSFGRASPVLRLLRVLRVFTAIGRTAKIKTPESTPVSVPSQKSRMLVNTLDETGIQRCAPSENICRITEHKGPAWVDIQDASPGDLDVISSIIHVPRLILESKLNEEAFPRIDYFKDYTTLFIRDLKLISAGDGAQDIKIARSGLLIVCCGGLIFTICQDRNTLFDDIVAEGIHPDVGDFGVQVLYSIFRHKVRDAEDLIRVMERKSLRMELLPVGKTPPSFLEDTFHLRRYVLLASKNLWHMRQVLDKLRTRKVMLDGITDEHMHLFDILFDEADYIHENAIDITESLSSLRELHINTISYEMTRVMRILAIITCLALVPSTVGGLLGENILGQPFPINLGEVMFIVIALMVLELYAFYKMGWLR
jgi:Mg2+ and Co2+ transporter CorA